MPTLPISTLLSYRRNTFNLDPASRLRSKEDAIAFINRRQFVFFWPIRDVVLPSLWAATAGDRPVPDEHDDPGHITWGWKDELLDKRVWYYARVLRKRNTFVSNEAIPYFYALSPNYGDPDQDYLLQYEQGLLTLESKLVYEALLKEGPLDSISLRKAARLSSVESTSRFNRALDTLQSEFKVLPRGIAEAGSWRYAFVYDLTHRYYPDLVEISGPITEPAARQRLLMAYFTSVGAATERDVQKLFGWRSEDLSRSVQTLVGQKDLIQNVSLEGTAQPVLAIHSLLTA